MRLELGKRHLPPNGRAVADDMQVVRLEVDHALALLVPDPGVLYVPFVWNDPVEHRRSGRNFGARNGNVFPQDVQGAAYAVSREAPADGKQLGGECVHLATDPAWVVGDHITF